MKAIDLHQLLAEIIDQHGPDVRVAIEDNDPYSSSPDDIEGWALETTSWGAKCLELKRWVP